VVYVFIKFVNTWVRDETFSLEELKSFMDMFKTFEEVLWIFDFSILDDNEEISDDILKILEERNIAKKDKNFEKADKIREQLLNKWYKIIDDRNGSRVERL
jgi:cysteinyl-tRNA synthetase